MSLSEMTKGDWVRTEVRKSLRVPREDSWGEPKGCLCDDCAIDVHSINEWFMVNSDLWPKGVRFLCLGCLETRLGRALQFSDFLPCWGNVWWPFSKGLQDRFDRSKVTDEWIDEAGKGFD